MLWWRFLFWLCNMLFWLLAAVGIFTFAYMMASIPEFKFMLYFLPIEFALIFLLVILGCILRYKSWDKLKEER